MPPAPAALDDRTAAAPRRGLVVLAGAALVLAVLLAGSLQLDAPWLQGDEHIFIATNPDVNPDAAPPAARRALGERLAVIFTKIHDDLYQPIPVASYALEWAATGGSPGSVRRTDLLLHAANALLLWAVLAALLRRTEWADAAGQTWLAWLLALIWALHPMLAMTYAADMGRTHLLSAGFVLLALLFHVRALDPNRASWFLAALAALLLAMLSKPVPGWVLVVFVLEAWRRGWRSALRSWRVWIVGVLCVAFAALTLWTSRQSGLTEDASKGLFGDPFSRSALAVWIYVRNLLAPYWLAVWYPPDPRTGWGNPLVWLGALLALGSLAHAGINWRRPQTRPLTLGWTWCWATLLPVIGLVGAREAAAVDRYFYQPLMGILLVVGVVGLRVQARLSGPAARRFRRAGLAIGVVIAAAFLLQTVPQAAIARSTLQRARRVVAMHPHDPRAFEALAAAYDFARNHAIPEVDAEAIPPDTPQFAYFNAQMEAALDRAAGMDDLASYFPGPEDRGPFHRRLSYRYLMCGAPQEALEQARTAAGLLPDEFVTHKRLAHAYQALGDYGAAAAEYERCETLLPDNVEIRAAHYTDYGLLLADHLIREREACEKFAAALATGAAPLPARIGAAACEIRYGRGDAGFELIRQVLAEDPGNVRAGMVLAEFHLRSHNFAPAAAVYAAILQDNPTHYAALRGFHETCLQTGEYEAAVTAWRRALRLEPGRREFASYLAWAEAVAGVPDSDAFAARLLEVEPENRLACLAKLLYALRQEDADAAVEWALRAARGTPVSEARGLERARATIGVLVGRGELTEGAEVVHAALYLAGESAPEDAAAARGVLERWGATSPTSGWGRAAKRFLRELSDAETLPVAP